MQELRAREDRVLCNYRWIDKKAGIVGIPIDRAVDLLALRGLPTREEKPPDHHWSSLVCEIRNERRHL